MTIKDAIRKVAAFSNLTEKEAYGIFSQIMNGKVSPSQIAALLTGLHMKGETVEEIIGAAKAMRKKAVKLKVSRKNGGVLDTCGTGGAPTDVFNISTVTAFVAAACGVRVAKHGNRSASGHCGSADVLEELGVKIDAPVSTAKKCMDSIGIAFLFAPLFHTAMRHAAAPRKEIGVRTIFNILGPLSNPAMPDFQVIGVFDKNLTEPMARVLKKLGTRRAFLVHGNGPLDEVSISGRTRVSELKNGKVRTYYVKAKDFGLKENSLKSIKGGTVKENAKTVREVLSGLKGPKRDIVLMNSAMALVAAGRAKGFKEGVRLSEEAIDSGRALRKLEGLIRLTREAG